MAGSTGISGSTGGTGSGSGVGSGSGTVAVLTKLKDRVLPPMIYASVRSQRNMMFDEGRSMDSSEHFGKSGLLLAIMVMLATVAMSFLMDIVNSQMPPMPE